MYSPFPGNIVSGFGVDDLRFLEHQQVCEGLFVEYKSQLTTPAKVANSIASFANSYGGWYIVGVEADKQSNVPIAFPGIAPIDCADPISSIRDSVRHHLDPVPRFFSELVRSDDGSVFVVVCVPEAQDKPIISKNGRIYRRVADSSDPLSESDRHAIDRIVDEGKLYRQRFIEFCRDERTKAKSEETSWLNIYLAPYPNLFQLELRITQDSLNELRDQCSQQVELPLLVPDAALSGSVRFGAAHTTADGIRLSSGNLKEIHLNQLSLELHHDAWARIRIPLVVVADEDFRAHSHFFGAEVNSLLVELTDTRYLLKFIDVGSLVLAIGVLIRIYERWLGDIPEGVAHRVKLAYSGTWRALAYYRSQEWEQFVVDNGLPVNLSDDISWPTREPYFLSDPNPMAPLWLWVAAQALLCLGLPTDQFTHALGAAVALAGAAD